LERETATSEILRVISSSPTDVRPVFAAVLRSAARLCDALDASIFQVEGDGLRLVAHGGPIPSHPVGEFPLIRGMTVGRAVLDRRTIHVPDVQAEVDEYPEASALARSYGFRTTLSVPLLRGTEAIGAIGIRRTEVRPFTVKQVKLLETFAAQAVIAIENVRLFKETKEALEQQTATADILRVIASSPTDLQPVMEAVAENAARVCGATDSSIFRLDREHLRLVARHGPLRRALAIGDSIPASRDSVSGRPVCDRRTIHVEDIMAAEAEFPATVSRISQAGSRTRTLLATPLLREGTPLGVIAISRGPEVHPFSAKQIALLETFANQAVIAIENVRLFTELEARNRELTESLEQQTATSEILRVIASSPTDIQPVFEAVAQNAARLCEAPDVVIVRVDGDALRWVTSVGPFGKTIAPDLRIPITRGSVAGRAAVDRRTIHVHDLAAEPDEEFPVGKALQGRYGHRTMVGAPLLREGIPLGVIAVVRTEVRPFSAKQIALLETFANQAVIAIENVRLFKETKEALEQQTATADILRVIASSPTTIDPVFDAILNSAVRLCGSETGLLWLYDGEAFRLVADRGAARQFVEPRRERHRPGANTGPARAVAGRRPVHIVDILADHAYAERDPGRLQTIEQLGARTGLWVPLLKEGTPIGVIGIWRRKVQAFSESQIQLLSTFADQAVIAIENVRLFTELQEKNQALTVANTQVTEALDQQTATSEILRVISSSPTDVKPVFDAIAKSSVRLCEGRFCTVYRFDGELIHIAAHHNLGVEGRDEMQRAYPMRPSSTRSPTARAIDTRAVVHSPDYESDREVDEPTRQRARRIGYRSGIAVPMLRAGSPIGCITVTRSDAAGGPRPFVAKELELLQTFADQAVIAIENVRLFKELEAKNRDLTESLEQQTATAEILRVISSSPTDVQPVFDAIAESAARLFSGLFVGVVRFDGGSSISPPNVTSQRRGARRRHGRFRCPRAGRILPVG
jgi:GAF domain-containing protein